jgi:uncharacterized protein (DUF1697 family)
LTPAAGPRQIVLLRGINIGSRRISMPDLRALLAEAGFGDVATYVQSGNVVLSSALPEQELATALEELISERFGFEVPVIVRSRDELAKVVSRNPLKTVVTNPKRYQVSFLERELEPEVVARLAELAIESERLVAIGRELYGWHPEGVARSKLWGRLANAGGLGGVTATARNWSTVTTLLEMADAQR